MLQAIRNNLKSKKGQGALEYALIVVVLVVIILAGMRLFGKTVTDRLTTIASNVPTQ